MREFLTLISALVILSVAGCTKEGVQGPAGANGTNGTNGINGTDGTNGNADVRLFLFEGPYTYTAANYTYPFSLTGITDGYIDSSLVLVYYDLSGTWYPAPGLGDVSLYQTRWSLVSGPTINLYVWGKDGSPYTGSNLYFTKVKIIVASASVFKAGKKEPVDFNNYKATMKYFNLAE